MSDSMNELALFQVDAFTDTVFHGNPAAVVPLTEWLADETMQAIAAENNLSETAFFVNQGETFGLRWFTPTTEVDLCGHATLATAFVLFHGLKNARDTLRFDTRSGELTVTRDGDRLVMDFPATSPRPTDPPDGLIEALGVEPVEVLASDNHNYYAVYSAEGDVAGLKPDMRGLEALYPWGVVATAPGEEVDFVSRYFVPAHGVPEDPVTGSTHCGLTPLWALRLERDELHARQISKRTGELFCKLKGERVEIAGNAILYLEGRVRLPV